MNVFSIFCTNFGETFIPPKVQKISERLSNEDFSLIHTWSSYLHDCLASLLYRNLRFKVLRLEWARWQRWPSQPHEVFVNTPRDFKKSISTSHIKIIFLINFLFNNSLDIKMTLYKIWKTFYDDLGHQEKNFWNFHLVFWINSIKRQKCFASISVLGSKIDCNCDEPQVNFAFLNCTYKLNHKHTFQWKWIINFQFFSSLKFSTTLIMKTTCYSVSRANMV